MDLIVPDKTIVGLDGQPIAQLGVNGGDPEAPAPDNAPDVSVAQVLGVIARPSPLRVAWLTALNVPKIVASLATFYWGWLQLASPKRMALFMEGIYLQGRQDSAVEIREAAHRLAPNRKARRRLARK